MESSVLYVDGGLLWNYPIDIFDFAGYMNLSPSDRMPMINNETLGLRIASTRRVPYEYDGKTEEKSIITLRRHIQSLVFTLGEHKAKNYERKENNFRTIDIDPPTLLTLDFEKFDEIVTKEALSEQGRQGALRFKSRVRLIDYFKITLPEDLHKAVLSYEQEPSVQTLPRVSPPALIVAFYSHADPNIQTFLHQNLRVPLWSRDKNGNTAFHEAVIQDQFNALERLLKVAPEGAQAKNFQHFTPNDFAITKDIQDLLSQYSVCGLDVFAQEPQKSVIFHH